MAVREQLRDRVTFQHAFIGQRVKQAFAIGVRVESASSCTFENRQHFMQIQACSSSMALNTLQHHTKLLKRYAEVAQMSRFLPAMLKEAFRCVHEGRSQTQTQEILMNLLKRVSDTTSNSLLPALVAHYVFQNSPPTQHAEASNLTVHWALHVHALEHIRLIHMLQGGLCVDTAWWRRHLSDCRTGFVSDTPLPGLPESLSSARLSYSNTPEQPGVLDVHIHVTLLGSSAAALPITADQAVVSDIEVAVRWKPGSGVVVTEAPGNQSSWVLELMETSATSKTTSHGSIEPSTTQIVYEGEHVVGGVSLSSPLESWKQCRQGQSTRDGTEAWHIKPVCHLQYRNVVRVRASRPVSATEAVLQSIGTTSPLCSQQEEQLAVSSPSSPEAGTDDSLMRALSCALQVEGCWQLAFRDSAAAAALESGDMPETAASDSQCTAHLPPSDGTLSMAIPFTSSNAV